LVLHAPFGSRVNRAWALALRKRFCRQFNFELQAGRHRGGPAAVARPAAFVPARRCLPLPAPGTVRDVLIQAVLDAPVFQTRWRWNATISLAVPRAAAAEGAAPLQRMQADDLLAAASPTPRRASRTSRRSPDPGSPARRQTVRDCLEEAMDLPRPDAILERIHAATIAASRATRPSRPASPRDPQRAAVRVPRRCAARGACGRRP
jgi:ATP-dependent Lhr-like helicase